MKKRIDILLTEKELAKSREKAKAQIIAGNVYANNVLVKNPSQTFDDDVQIRIKEDECPYVSRGGLKLKKAITQFNIDLQNKVCLDIGASTGGFTHCMLLSGASYVYAIDVGYGQFDWSLRNNKNVELYERTNARYLEKFEKPIDFVSVDVSFISLNLIFPAIKNVAPNAQIVTLIKPQFEAGKNKVGKKGVVREQSTHIEVINNVINYGKNYGFYVGGVTYSPIKGPNGNIEYLAFFSHHHKETYFDVVTVVKNAHINL